MKSYFPIVFFALAFLLSCSTYQPNSGGNATPNVNVQNVQPTPSATPEMQTITKIDELADNASAVFKAPNGKIYTVESEEAEPETDTEVTLPGDEAADAPTKKNEACESDNFDGKDRKAAKISVDAAALESFDKLDDFIKTLPTYQKIGDERNPEIGSGETSKRVKEERRNVRIKTAWLYAFKRESDEDYHVIIGSTPDKLTAVFFNVEISGLPSKTSASFARLNSARNSFTAFFGIADKCTGDSYKKFTNTPIEVEITGSIFFDKLHFDGKGAIGPKDARAKSYWEIHPITKIVFK